MTRKSAENKFKKDSGKSGLSEVKRKQIEDALRQSELKYRTITENITVGIFRSTPGPKGRFIEVNSALVKMLGYKSKDELIVKEIIQIFQNPKERNRYHKKLIEKERIKNEELILLKKDGSPIIVSETAITVKDKSGKILYFDGILEDITERKKVEKEFQLQKTYLEELFNSAPEAIVLHDHRDKIINVNDEFTRLFGYTREEAIGKPINRLLAPKGYEKEAAGFSSTVINGQRVSADSQRKRKDGRLINVSILGAPIFHDGKQIGVYAIYRDISERKKAEEEILIQKTYLERLYNSAPEAIVLHGNNDLILNVNDEFTRMFGYTPEEAIGKPINDLLASKEVEEEATEISAKVIRGEKIDLESKRKRKDGTMIDVSILGAPIIHNGSQIGDYAIYRDITERKIAEEELLIQKTYLEKLFNSAPEAIVWHDNDDTVINVNDEFTRTFGYTREEAIGRPINELVAPEGLKDEAARLSANVVHGEIVEIETRRKRKDGSIIEVSILGAPIDYDGEQIGVYAIYRDITEKKRAEETRLRLREEARMARAIQTNLLPKSNPRIPGYDIAGKSIPAMNVGGDYYDFIAMDKQRLAIGLGDVSGKGLAASLVMSNLQATIRGQTFFDVSANECLEHANTLLYQSTDSRTFVSLFYGILDPKKHTLSYANAGQNMPIIFSKKKKPLQLKTRGIALGIQNKSTYRLEELQIEHGDMLLIYSDGVTEAMNKRMTQFGDKRLKTIVKKNMGLPAGELVEIIVSEVNKHFGGEPQNDDMTIIVLIRK